MSSNRSLPHFSDCALCLSSCSHIFSCKGHLPLLDFGDIVISIEKGHFNEVNSESHYVLTITVLRSPLAYLLCVILLMF